MLLNVGKHDHLGRSGLGHVDIAEGVASGVMTVGDFVRSTSTCCNSMCRWGFGFVYREIKQSMTDVETMFQLLNVSAEITDDPRAKPVGRDDAEVAFDNVIFGYRAGAQFSRVSRRFGEQNDPRRRPERRYEVNNLATALPLL